MIIANISILRVIAHEVVRATAIPAHPPLLSEALVVVDDRGRDLVAKRLVETVASGSHCVDVTVDDASPGSPFDLATAMLDSTDDVFVDHSKQLARSLSTAQTAGAIKSGSAMFVQGTCTADRVDSRFLAIIKADSDQALYKDVTGDQITLTFVNDMLLGESQRLIKIALFIEEADAVGEDRHTGHRDPEQFAVKVFDHLMQLSGDGQAALYFYSTFLKCSLAQSAARVTRQFYQLATAFVDELRISPIERTELHGDVISYLRGQLATIEPRTFAREVLPPAYRDDFLRTCHDNGIADAFSKNLDLLKGKLRRQSITFTSNVTIYAPPDVFRDAVKITGVTDDGWTQIKVRGDIEPMS